MEVCPQCFADKEIKGLFLASSTLGNCKICGACNVPLLDITELLDFFQELFNNFQVSSQGEPLINKIQKSWNFFTNTTIATNILNALLSKLYTNIKSADELVDYIDDIVDNVNYWEELKEELKWSRRFLSDVSYLEELGWDGYFNTQYELITNDKLYRARIHHKSGLAPYSFDEMMCPPPSQAGGGRANPMGIPYLYLSDNPETVLYEIRATYLDEVSVGTFHLKEANKFVKIVDFTEETALFQPTKVNETIKARVLRDKISKDLSKPMRRYDSEIEYIPTQFICEFIKVITNASGIRFSSSLHPDGKNVVIFDQNLMQCTEVKLVKITKLDLRAIDL